MMQPKNERNILVSVVCATFNHREYLADALDGFVMQKTDFSFEVIVHDDASTDGTTEIVEDYARKFPDLIRPVIQHKNQYSKGGFKPTAYAAKYAKGKFIALCEGDDYWTDPQKLQRQADLLDEHPEIHICIHPAMLKTASDTSRLFGHYGDHERIVPVEQLIQNTQVATASIMVRKEVIDELPEWFHQDAPYGDYYIRVLAAVPNGAHYIPNVMSVYRYQAVGSWTSRTHRDMDTFTNLQRKVSELSDVMDVHLGHRYTSGFQKYRARLLIARSILLAKRMRYKEAGASVLGALRNPVALFRALAYMVGNMLKAPRQTWASFWRNL